MTIPTTEQTSELAAVNEILASIGQAPVNSIDQTNPDVSIAFDTLKSVSREIQAEGWSFNKEHHYPLARDNNKEIAIPNNMLQLDVSTKFGAIDAVRRNGKLYNRNTHGYTFEQDLEGDVVWFFDWADLPIPIQDYITARAAAITSSRLVGDNNQFGVLSTREAKMRASAIEYDCNQGDYTYFGHPDNGNFYTAYQPFRALRR